MNLHQTDMRMGKSTGILKVNSMALRSREMFTLAGMAKSMDAAIMQMELPSSKASAKLQYLSK